MAWSLEEAISYYRNQGAPRDQSALVALLKEIQQEHGGAVPLFALGPIAESYSIKVTFLEALIKRIPSLRLDNTHTLELCSGRNCGKHTELAAYAEELHTASGRKFTLKFVPCMRMCAKGPNLKWDGRLHHGATKELLQNLLKDAGIDF